MIVGPSLISQDLRFNALPLYFSRPLRRIDYFMGKLGVIGWFLAMVLIFPSLIAYALGLLFSRDFSIITDTFPLLLASLGYGIVVSLSAGLFILALSSLSRNSRYIALAWLAVWFVTSLASEALEGIHGEQKQRQRYETAQAMRRTPRPATVARTPQEQEKQFREQQELERKAWADYEASLLEEMRGNWRPMVSYTANLSRVGRQLLGTDTAWRRFAESQPPEVRTRYLLQNLGPQYPWYWSAGLLAGLVGISACILNFRVKSLDRLK